MKPTKPHIERQWCVKYIGSNGHQWFGATTPHLDAAYERKRASYTEAKVVRVEVRKIPPNRPAKKPTKKRRGSR